VADKWDGPGRGLTPVAFAPVHGDRRLLLLHERHGRAQPLIWDVASDTETEIGLDLPGEVTASWYPDGKALLIVHVHQGRRSLYRYQLSARGLSSLDTPAGWIGEARVRPDGSVEYSWSSAAKPMAIRAHAPDGTDEVLLIPPGERAPESVPVTDAFVDGPGGRIHALVSRPSRPSQPSDLPDGPLPTVFTLHGGPHYADEDRFSAYHAAWVDAGFAVVRVNYRGSTGYGSAWRDAIEGRPGLTELEDVAAVHDWSVRSGLADPARCVLAGPSWGGYLTLLALGTQPGRWAAAVASIPIADYVAEYEDEMEQLRSYDRALFGGSPDAVPEAYQRSSPITYVDAVRTPVLVLAGTNDPRCPIRQIENYLGRLAGRGIHYEVYRFDAGHGSLVTAETINQTMAEVHFARRVIDTVHMELLQAHHAAITGFGQLVDRIGEGQWDAPTPCTEWTVRDLLNHVLAEQLWELDLLAGRTIAEVGDRYDGDLLGDDPAARWRKASQEATEAVQRPGALDGEVQLSRGSAPASEYMWEMTLDLAVHGWDLARAIGAETPIDAALAEALLAVFADQVPGGPDLFDPPVPVGPDADPPARLIALVGRQP
jgi:uncharacterized protein (TIGR03086 family)